MSRVFRYLQEVVTLTESVRDLRSDVQRIDAVVQSNHERLIVIETLIEAATGRPLPSPGRRR